MNIEITSHSDEVRFDYRIEDGDVFNLFNTLGSFTAQMIVNNVENPYEFLSEYCEGLKNSVEERKERRI